MIKRLDRISSLVILALILLYIGQALQFPGNAKIVPTIFGGLALVVVVVQLLAPRIKAFKALGGDLEIEDERDLAVFREPLARRRFLLIAGSLLAIPVVIALVGLPLALPLYVAAMLLIERQRIPVVIACTGLISAAAYGLLVRLLGWPVDEGVLWRFLGGA
jgi:hypothetical protein